VAVKKVKARIAGEPSVRTRTVFPQQVATAQFNCTSFTRSAANAALTLRISANRVCGFVDNFSRTSKKLTHRTTLLTHRRKAPVCLFILNSSEKDRSDN
jgi:hypothetical protein